jgi:hypothetical protein
MRRFFVELPEPIFETLAKIADRERRPVRDQAGYLLECALGQRDALVPPGVDGTPSGWNSPKSEFENSPYAASFLSKRWTDAM